ncbi:hypothetical protein [Aeromicrobium sp. Sec7.5]|uniref:hypothetical protein n=1 Tax=Aeromicrobium sp. Sec7.5 TaxID=3121276 RepID=UPI002FE4F4C6
MRRTATGLMVVLVVTVLAGCGDVNKGSAFAAEFQVFLDGRDDLEVAEAGGTNPLPWSGTGDVSVEVVAGLSDDEVVDAVWEITAHEVENQVSYDLEVRFPTQTDTGDPALAAFHLGVPGPAPEGDEAELRREIERRLGIARTLVGFGIGETEASAGPDDFRMRSTGDALAVATALCDDTGLERVVDYFFVEGPAPDGTLPGGTVEDDLSTGTPGSRVTLVDAGDCSWLSGMTEILALMAVPGAVTSYSAEHSEFDDRPSLRVTLAPTVPVDVAPAQARAAELGVDVYFA